MAFVFIGLTSTYWPCAGTRLSRIGDTRLALSDLCPYNNYCHTNASIVLSSTVITPCCRPCSCQADCWKRGDCCPDKEPPSTLPSVEQCLDTIVVRRDERDKAIYNGLNHGIPRYYVVESCPDSEINDLTAMKCSVESKETLDDVTWVTGTENGKIYKNKFCAECHGVRNFIKWDIATSCFDILDADSFKPGTLIPKGCRLSAYPPESIKDISTNLCVLPTVSQCNVTGKWEKYDNYTEESCAAYELPFLDDTPSTTDVYRNVFCYLCNKDDGELKMDACRSLAGESLRLGSGGFIVLLNQRTSRETIDEQLEERCGADEVYEPIQVHRGSCMSANVLLILLNELRKGDTFQGLPSILYFSHRV